MSAGEEPLHARRPQARILADELAVRVGVTVADIEQLAALGVLERDGAGTFEEGDVHRARLLRAFRESGVPLDVLVDASRAGKISLAYYDELHDPPGALSDRTYAEFIASLGPEREHATRMFTAMGLAEPDPDSRLPAEDEALVALMLDLVARTGQPDLALRGMRVLGEGMRRAAEAALGAYGEAVRREGDISALQVDETFDLLLRPWAMFARKWDELAAWLSRHHMSRAIDEYSVNQTEAILEASGYVAARLDSAPAVAFVDLTGFTRLTEELGDEVATEMAMRLGELAAEITAPRGGRVVKLLGDGVLVRFDDADGALEATLELLEALPAHGLPTAHAGIARGTLIARDGDVFGRTVNLAARLADAAPDGRLYVTEALASTLPARRFVTRPVDQSLLQGLGRVALADVTRPSTEPA